MYLHNKKIYKNCQIKCFGSKNYLVKKKFYLKKKSNIFWVQIFFWVIFFTKKHFLTKKYFWPKYIYFFGFWSKKIFGQKNFFFLRYKFFFWWRSVSNKKKQQAKEPNWLINFHWFIRFMIALFTTQCPSNYTRLLRTGLHNDVA